MMSNRITRPAARVLAEEEFTRFADLVASLTPEEWATPTDCPGWDVRKMVLHVLGSGDAQASVREFVHQFRRGMPLNKEIDSHHWVDGMNELQIRERSQLSNDELEGREGAVGHTTAGPIHPASIRTAHRMGTVEVPARCRVHTRRLGTPYRHPCSRPSPDVPHSRS
jgi:uncharacterized protein (TIGR03083 family)